MSYIVKSGGAKYGPFTNWDLAEDLVSRLALAHVQAGNRSDVLIEETSGQEGFFAEGTALSAAEAHAVHVHLHQEPKSKP